MFISYAQNGEDVWLNRVFEGKNDGFYIDVGAHQPEFDSVTKAFYDKGWNGINIEPIPDLHQMFVKERPRDINLQCACGAQNATLNLHLPPVGKQGVATLDANTAQYLSQTIGGGTLLPVQVTTLAEICAKYARDAIDFLKIDVEGYEENVVRGMDFQEFRPIVLIVEATKPLCLMRDPVADAAYGVWHSWEPLLMSAGYVFATFDGLSRYYVRKEDQHLVAKFIIPISPLVDGYVKYSDPTATPSAVDDTEKDDKKLSRQAARFHYLHREQSIPFLPSKYPLHSKACTQADIDSPWCAYWTEALKMQRIYHRKIWEQAYVPQALFNADMLQKGKKGIVFGCGREPLPALFARMGVYVTATDAPPELGWKGTCMYADSLKNLYYPDLIDEASFKQRVCLEYVDMNHIPQSLQGQYDFCWSICALEHLGGLQAGLDFIVSSLNVLKNGGVAVHTTEFNYADNEHTISTGNAVLYQRQHFEELFTKLTSQNHEVAPLDFFVGDGIFDRYIDMPPYEADGFEQGGPHLKLELGGYASTCFGLIITKNPGVLS